MNTNPYKEFGNYVLRTPTLPVNYILNLTQGETVSDRQLKEAWEDEVIKEAIYCASPSFYNSFEKWINGTLNDKKRIDKLKVTFLKYLTRMSMRCTPFGLFAGVSLGRFGDKTKIELKEIDSYDRFSRFEHEILIKISKKLVENIEIKEKLKYTTNNSIYVVGDELRYVHINYNDYPRGHKINSIKRNFLLDELLKYCEQGVEFNKIIEFITNDEIDANSAKGFVNKLIESQVIVSELEPNNIGFEYFDRVLSILSRVNFEDQNLIKIKGMMTQIELKIGNKIDIYEEIDKLISSELHHKENQINIRTDLFVNTESNVINKTVVTDLKKGFDFLNKFSLNKVRGIDIEFINAFKKRYGERKISLAKVLDSEMGIGFLQNTDKDGMSELIDDVAFPLRKKMTKKEYLTSRGDLFLIDKSKDKEPGEVLTLKDEDLNSESDNWVDYKLDWSSSHDTLNTNVQIIKDKGEIKYYMNGIWGPTGAAWISRFGSGNENISDFIEKITRYEQNVKEIEDVIIAEVSYFPKSNLSGAMIKENFRDFEIPYLTFSLKSCEKQILLKDLFVYVENGILKIWSNKLKKRVIPRVTDAHKFDYGSLPFYHFLCEIQFQGKRLGSSFLWNKVISEVSFLPRVEYKNIIFKLAHWRVRKNELIDILSIKKDEYILKEIAKWRKSRRMPSVVVFSHFDQELVINFNNVMSIKVLFSEIKENRAFVLTEFLYTTEGIVKRGANHFTNEIMIPFYNSSKL